MSKRYAASLRRGGQMALAVAALVATTGCRDTFLSRDEVLIGGVFSLTGNWSSLGKASEAALEIAVEDVNAYVGGDGPKFVTGIEDSKLNPATALAKVTKLRGQGAHIVIGPQSSAEVAALKSYVDQNEVLLVSQSSTAGSLAIAGDNIFRLTPSDTLEGLAVSALMRDDGVRAIVPVNRTDPGNAGLVAATRTAFSARGGVVTTGVTYADSAPDFAAAVAALRTQVQQAIATYGVGRVGVYLAGFDEATGIIARAGNDSLLVSVPWYGGDGLANSAALQADARVVQFSERVGLATPIFGLDPQAAALAGPVARRIRARTGAEPDAFALAVYDATWIAALAYLASDDLRPEMATIRERYQTIASTHFGTTGWTALNAAGDRATANFDFVALRRVSGAAQWVTVAHFNTASGALTR